MFKQIWSWLEQGPRIERLALRAEMSARRLNGLPPHPSAEPSSDAITVLESTCLLLEPLADRPRQMEELHPRAESAKWAAEDGASAAGQKAGPTVVAQPLGQSDRLVTPQSEDATRGTGIGREPEPSATAKELIKMRDWVLLARSSGGTVYPEVLEEIYAKLGQLLSREDVESIEKTGAYDRDMQLVVETEVTDIPDRHDTVCRTARPGYSFRGRVLRPQEVVLFSLPSADNSQHS